MTTHTPTLEKLRYKIMTKKGKIKSYLDKSFCYCDAYQGPHKHPKSGGK